MSRPIRVPIIDPTPIAYHSEDNPFDSPGIGYKVEYVELYVCQECNENFADWRCKGKVTGTFYCYCDPCLPKDARWASKEEI